MTTKTLLRRTTLVGLLLINVSGIAAQPLPQDLQLVSSLDLPTNQGTWFSLQNWDVLPPVPYNWCDGLDNVFYYQSSSFGTNRIIIDDTAISPTLSSSSMMTSSTTSPPPPPGGGGGGTDTNIYPQTYFPGFKSNDLWLEIRFDTNLANQVDVILHGATNGVWQLLSKTEVANTNMPWKILEVQIDDGTTNTLYFGPYYDLNPFTEFFKAKLATNLFTIVSTNLPQPVGVDYDEAMKSLILPINFNSNDPTFGILDTNHFLTNWSGLSQINFGFEVRIFTAKNTTNGLTAGDLLFGNGNPGGIGWLSADGKTSNLNFITISAESNLVETIYIDQTGIWNNDVLAVAAQDFLFEAGTPLNVWQIHNRTNAHLIASIPAQHLEGLLTVPTDSRYGPFAGKLLTADEPQHTIFTVSPTGSVSNLLLGINPDQFLLIPTNQDLYCVQFEQVGLSRLLQIPGGFFRRFQGDILVEQAGESLDEPTLFILHWNGTSFDTHSIALFDFFPNDGFFEKTAFAPISIKPVQ